MTEAKIDLTKGGNAQAATNKALATMNVMSGTKLDGASVDLGGKINGGMGESINDKVGNALQQQTMKIETPVPEICQSLKGCATENLAEKAIAATSAIKSQSITATMGASK